MLKTTSMFGAATLALALAACGGSETPAPKAAAPAAEAPVAEVPAAEPEAPIETVAVEPEAPAAEAPVVEAAAPEAPVEAPVETPVEAPAAEVIPASAPADASATGYAALTGDAAKGKRVFTQCMSCHAVAEGRNLAGPSLYGIVGRPAGTIEGFKYSTANKDSGIVWTEETMFAYLENPQEYIKGTIMSFRGLPKPQDRADVIAYLKSVPES